MEGPVTIRHRPAKDSDVIEPQVPSVRERRAAVVHITCPACGGDVDGTELGARARCRYCGVELHVPAVDMSAPRSADVGEKTENERSEDPPLAQASTGERRIAVLVLGMLLVAILFAYLLAPSKHWPSPSTREASTGAEAPERAADPGDDLLEALARGDCVRRCGEACAHPGEPETTSRCIDSCNDSCQAAGKGRRRP